jgi:hypothetical protein
MKNEVLMSTLHRDRRSERIENIILLKILEKVLEFDKKKKPALHGHLVSMEALEN